MTFFQAFLCGVIYWIGNCSFARAYFVFSKPLVAGFLVGLVFGNPLEGAMIGAQINMIYLGWIGAGGASPADSRCNFCQDTHGKTGRAGRSSRRIPLSCQ